MTEHRDSYLPGKMSRNQEGLDVAPFGRDNQRLDDAFQRAMQKAGHQPAPPTPAAHDGRVLRSFRVATYVPTASCADL